MVNPFWKERKVLVTGATGLVGSWLVADLVAQGATVVALVLDADPQSELYRSGTIHKTHVVNGRLEDLATLERAINAHEIDTVFHLGAQTIVGTAHRDPHATFESNIRGTYNLLEACRIHKSFVKRIVVASSDKAYGPKEELPYTEDMSLEGYYPYEVSKSCTDLLAQSYAYSYDLPVVIVRCGNIYGGGDLNWSRIVPGTIRSLIQGEAPVIRSDGKFVRDYVYVRDVCRVYMKLAEKIEAERLNGEAYNYSLEEPLTVFDIVTKITELMPSDLEPRILNAVQGEIHSQYLSSQKLRKIITLDDEARLDRGLTETINWYRSFFQR